MSSSGVTYILCNGAQIPNGISETSVKRLDYLPRGEANVRVGLPSFVSDVYHLPTEILDLLELASFIFAADRLVHRGQTKAVEYQSWSRNLHFVVRVRNPSFWRQPELKRDLSRTLEFLTGDSSIDFSFQDGHETQPTNLFDRPGFTPPSREKLVVQLFSGGIDSLAGAATALETDEVTQVCLVSHQANPKTIGVQRALVEALKTKFPQRLWHYEFETHLTGVKPNDESQRSRSFLYTSIAFAIAQAHGESAIRVHENGVTSLNLPRRGDLGNARASRTTHPRVITGLQRIFEHFTGSEFQVKVPFQWKTKTDVVQELGASSASDLLSTSVSCSKTFQHSGPATHCGECFQCVDRRLAVYAANLEQTDGNAIYGNDLIREPVSSREAKTVVVDYLRQARQFSKLDGIGFLENYASELSDAAPFVGYDREMEGAERLFKLCSRHGTQVQQALRRVRDEHDDPFSEMRESSLLALVSQREHLKTPTRRLVARISKIVQVAIPKAFASDLPRNEADLNEKVAAILSGHRDDLKSEHPTVRFACAHAKPDHSLTERDVWIEGKYIRDGMPPSKASEGIAADITKYPPEVHVLFAVFDPEHQVSNDREFKEDFEARGNCTIEMIR